MKKTLPIIVLGMAMCTGGATLRAQNVTASNITGQSASVKAAAVNVKLTGTLTTSSNGDFRQLRDLCYQMQKLDLSTATCPDIPKNALHSRHNLRTLTLPNKVQTIGSQAFFACDSLTGTLTIPSSTTSIGASAFAGCKKLTGVKINGISLKNIGSYAFEGCESLAGTVTVPMNVRVLRDGVFSGCKSLESVTLNSNLQSIGANAFYGCESLSGDINLGKMITKIGAAAFSGCKSLTAISLPRALQQLGDAAFMDCEKLSGKISIPGSVEELGQGAFMNCKAVEEVVLPAELGDIKAVTFAGMTGLTAVTNYAETPNKIDATAFAGVDCANVKLYVPAASIDLYKAADVWKDFIIETVTGIDAVNATAAVTVSVEGNQIWVKNLPKAAHVALHNAQGKLLGRLQAEGTTSFTLTEPGVYVVTVNGKSFKVNY